MTQSADKVPPESPAARGVSRAKTRFRPKRLFKEIGRSPVVLRLIGRSAAGYMRLVAATSRMRFEPPGRLLHYMGRLPVIVTAWHGHHYLAPTFWPIRQYPLATLVSLSRDGEIMSAFVNGIGITPIRGSGGRDPKRTIRSGGIRGFLGMKSMLESGISVFMTADIPTGGPRRAGDGIIRLSRATGRPIVAIGVASAPQVRLDNQDGSRIALPFGRTVCAVSLPVEVPPDADEAEIEARRLELEAALNSATAEAYALLERGDG